MMNVYDIARYAEDVAHVAAFAVLFLKYGLTRSCEGISGTSQILYLLVYCARYLDIFVNYMSLYDYVLGCFFIGASIVSVTLIFTKFRKINSYAEEDPIKIGILVCIPLSMIYALGRHWLFTEISWRFSILIEAEAMLAQIWLITKTWKTDYYTLCYLTLMTLYRIFYIGQNHQDNILNFAFGVTQSLLFGTFIIMYIPCTRKEVARKPSVFLVSDSNCDQKTRYPCDASCAVPEFDAANSLKKDTGKSEPQEEVINIVEETSAKTQAPETPDPVKETLASSIN